ncbi:MAG: hypothetical protein ACFFD9_09615 [Candidatus Thorarchaeota archaeon]
MIVYVRPRIQLDASDSSKDTLLEVYGLKEWDSGLRRSVSGLAKSRRYGRVFELSNEAISFQCGVCSERIVVGSTDRVRVVDKQPVPDSAIGKMDTYNIESECSDGEIHVNIIVVDSDGRYRGHKHSAKRESKRIDTHTIDDLRRILSFGDDLSKVFSTTLRGKSFLICGEEEDCQIWLRTLPRIFSLNEYETKPWIYLIEDFVESYRKDPFPQDGVIGPLDSGLIRQAITALPETPRVELRNRTVYQGESLAYAKNLVKMLRAIPASEDRALVTLVSTELDSLRNLLNELTQNLESALTETVVLGAGQLSEVDFIESVINQVLASNSSNDLKSSMKREELEILAPHLIQRVPALRKAFQGKPG